MRLRVGQAAPKSGSFASQGEDFVPPEVMVSKDNDSTVGESPLHHELATRSKSSNDTPAVDGYGQSIRGIHVDSGHTKLEQSKTIRAAVNQAGKEKCDYVAGVP